jgi:hypothetical protein
MPNIQDILIQTFTNLINQFTTFVPNFISALVLILVGVGVAKLVASIISKVLEKANIDRLGDKINKMDFVKGMGFEIKLSALMAQVVYFFIMLIFVASATNALQMQFLTDLVSKTMILIPKLITAAIMLFVGLIIADYLKKSVVTICRSLGISAGKLLGSAVFFFFMVISLIAALAQAEINTSLLESSFNIIIGGIIFAFAVGYGIASRDVLANILSSFYSKNKFKEGQTIAIDGVKGEIIAIDATSVTLKTGDTQTILPMGMFQNSKVEVFE